MSEDSDHPLSFENFEIRVCEIFQADEVPSVSRESLEHYLAYLRTNLKCPIKVTGIESMGSFSWEERYSFGYGDKAEYKRLRKERGSYKDTYRLHSLEKAEIVEGYDIYVRVIRPRDRKAFTLGLSDLKLVDENSPLFVMLDDYVTWRVNY